MYRLFIASLPTYWSLSHLKNYFQAYVTVSSIEKNKSRGRHTVYHAILTVADKRDFDLLLRGDFVYEGQKLEINKYVSRGDRLSQDELVKGRKVHIGNIPPQWEASSLRGVLHSFGEIEDVYIRKDKQDKALYAFVTFKLKEDADGLIARKTLQIAEWGELMVSNYTSKPVSNSNTSLDSHKRAFRCRRISDTEKRPSGPSLSQSLQTPPARPRRPRQPNLYYYPQNYKQMHFGMHQVIPGERYPGHYSAMRTYPQLYSNTELALVKEPIVFKASYKNIRTILRDLSHLHLPKNIRLNQPINANQN